MSLYKLDKYLNIDPSKSAITDKERKEAISRVIGSLIIDKDNILRKVQVHYLNFIVDFINDQIKKHMKDLDQI